jgi:hypothetical protein
MDRVPVVILSARWSQKGDNIGCVGGRVGPCRLTASQRLEFRPPK